CHRSEPVTPFVAPSAPTSKLAHALRRAEVHSTALPMAGRCCGTTQRHAKPEDLTGSLDTGSRQQLVGRDAGRSHRDLGTQRDQCDGRNREANSHAQQALREDVRFVEADVLSEHERNIVELLRRSDLLHQKRSGKFWVKVPCFRDEAERWVLLSVFLE